MKTKEINSILVIDDDADDFEIVREAIREIAPHIMVYYLERCEDVHRYKDLKIDLVLLDINMPYYDGFYWLKGIRQSNCRQVPVVMYTNSANPENIIRAYNDGANLYYTKPSSFSDLLSGFKKLIHLDWANPSSITQRYYHNGQYATF